MSIRVDVVCTGADGIEQRREVMVIERAELAMETLGMILKESKALLKGMQDLMVEVADCFSATNSISTAERRARKY